ncbi:hemicentin-2 isoform X1 [Tribolium castaneum]|uniref:hemicentin-2 isoform X1 n=2 Tax=Tribolium castaneum TaxID=7070 RepID=UPI0000D56A15|nr:PREDICTED: hemicentin-2 isoform X1 [Tribolium castaneum]|eukprot:XP_008195943.1 PREDICTED: hemicentin-2 isoform X1 [Tribolium castaneum]
MRWVLVFGAICCCVTCQTLVPDEEEAAIVSSVDAVLGRSATLPCDIDPGIREDRVYMVLWYRDTHTKPIYSFDVRGRPFNKAIHWSDPMVFGPRAYFVTVSKPAALTLDGVTLNDEGIYRCRVDFRTTPTRNFAINLTVIVPPHQVLVYDNSGRDIVGIVGPLEEGADLVLTCEVRGGRPTPTVSWFMNERLVEGDVEAIGDTLMVNRLAVKAVRREHLNSTYKCQASNTKLMMPAEKTVRLELLLRPLSVVIPYKPRQMVAKQDYTIQCQVTGSRPKATVTWTRDNRDFRRGKFLEEGNETVVISSVTFSPEPEDDGTFLKCLGDNPKLPGFSQEDSFKLNVVYPPKVELHLGSTLNPEDIKEGDDVYFECIIKANPKQHKITWFHDGTLVSQNMSSGVIISTHSLVLQRVTRWQSGAYTCLAANPRGENVSNPVMLRVRYAPVCRDTEMAVIGASLNEVIKVRCHVSADPSDVTFVWQFNNSGESFDVSPARISASIGNVSELMYTTSSQRDYGTLTCWGKNSIGRQAEPCVFQVVPAAKPSPLTNCTLRAATNHSSDVLEVECRAGYDGGLPQRFILEAYDAYTMRLRLNLSSAESDVPVFRLDLGEMLPPSGDGFPPSLRIVVYAQNAKGRSEKLVLEDIMLNDAEKRTDGSSNMSILPIAALLTGSLLTLGIAVLLIVVLAVRRKHRHCGGGHCSYQLDPSKQPKVPGQSSRPGSMLEINTGDNRYVVAYTLKPAADCGTQPSANSSVDRQPDILNTPRGADTTTPPGLPRPDALFTPSTGERNRQQHSPPTFPNFSHEEQISSPEVSVSQTGGTLGRPRPRPRDISYSNFATMRRDHIIADAIPGPESCV